MDALCLEPNSIIYKISQYLNSDEIINVITSQVEKS